MSHFNSNPCASIHKCTFIPSDLGQTILWETKRHEGDMDILGSKFRTLQNDLFAAVHDKNILEIKLVELDQLVGQLLSVNESLVVRLSGKPLTKAPTQSSKTTVIKKKKVPVQHSSRATTSTQTASNSTTNTTFDDVKNLHGMHKMYVNLAHTITAPLVPSTLKKVRGASSGGVVTGKVLNSSTLMRNKKNQSPDDHVNYNDESSTTNVSVRIPSIFMDNRFNVDESMTDGQYSNTSHSGNFGTTRHGQNSDIEGLITSLEEEFNMLNVDYRHLLELAQAQPSTTESSLADDLVAVIQKLHKKGEQLRALKAPNRR